MKEIKNKNEKHYDPILENESENYSIGQLVDNHEDRIETLEDTVQTIVDVVSPEAVTFGDGSIVNTQATRAEDIVSVKDISQDTEIALKLDVSQYESETQIQDNRLTVLEQGQLSQDDRIDLNSNAILQIDGRLTTTESDVSTLQTENAAQQVQIDANETRSLQNETNIGVISNLTTNNKTNLVSAVNEVDGNVDINTNKNLQQDLRLNNLEQVLSIRGSDYSLVKSTSPRLIGTTPFVIEPIISKDFATQNAVAVNTIDGTTFKLSTEILYDSTVAVDFYFNATQGSATLVNFTVELFNVTQNTVVDSAVIVCDFSSSIDFATGERTLIGDVSQNDVLEIRAYSDIGDINITNSAGNIQVTALQGSSEIIFDNNVQSTNLWGNFNVKEDLDEIFGVIGTNGSIYTQINNKADITYVDSENAAQDVIIANLTDRVEVVEGTTAEIDGKVDTDITGTENISKFFHGGNFLGLGIYNLDNTTKEATITSSGAQGSKTLVLTQSGVLKGDLVGANDLQPSRKAFLDFDGQTIPAGSRIRFANGGWANSNFRALNVVLNIEGSAVNETTIPFEYGSNNKSYLFVDAVSPQNSQIVNANIYQSSTELFIEIDNYITDGNRKVGADFRINGLGDVSSIGSPILEVTPAVKQDR